MKKIMILSLLISVYSQGSYAAAVKAVLSPSASESQAQSVAHDAAVSSGGSAKVVRDSVTGKVTEVQITLPENDNAGLARAKEALIQNAGVATVHVEQQGNPVYEATGGLVSSTQGQTVVGGTWTSMPITVSAGLGPYAGDFSPAGVIGNEYGLRYSTIGSWFWPHYSNDWKLPSDPYLFYYMPGVNTTGQDVLEVIKIMDANGNYVSIPFIVSK